MKIKVNGPIIPNDQKWIYDEFEIEATSPQDVLGKLPEDNRDVVVSINSYGGNVDSGNEIYTELRNYNGHVTVEIVMAGSAASIIAMAGDEVKISPVGQIMIHNVSMLSRGDYRDMDKASEILRKSNDSLASAYVAKTGHDKEAILELMDKETWLTAEEAVDYGFVDAIMFDEDRPVLVASALQNGMLPMEVIEKYQEEKLNKVKEEPEIRKGFLF